MAARTENFDALEPGSGHLAEEFRGQFVRYEQVGREQSLHGFPGLIDGWLSNSLPLFSFRICVR
jgi:hypothetical protein